jgi:hypothetical protein
MGRPVLGGRVEDGSCSGPAGSGERGLQAGARAGTVCICRAFPADTGSARRWHIREAWWQDWSDKCAEVRRPAEQTSAVRAIIASLDTAYEKEENDPSALSLGHLPRHQREPDDLPDVLLAERMLLHDWSRVSLSTASFGSTA